MNHKGNWMGTFLEKFWMDKAKFTRAGLEPATSGLMCRRSTNWANSPYIGGVPILSISLFGGRQSEVLKPYTAL